MARAITAKYEELILEVEDASGTFLPICGMVDVTISRTSNMDTSEVPDCDDESLPMALERSVRSQEVTVSGSGVWADQSNDMMQAWWRSGATKNVQIRNAKASTGTAAIESGPAYLVNLNNGRSKGQKVSAEIEIQFDGVPAIEDAA